ncbi:MAG: tRNA dihydrouridine synthase DusB [Bacteroidota bacterium]|nr:tRNA dihydrouridine synthase DusB [Bacteroidota bacterium]MDP4234518.1 tRNA dihydrouridine synthase DusB [Bacteroidota bacterium]MDP4242583.1 tRNA dihydrouridine synthase DusB [Bacteroidota bacterium]MDP4289387.1 tRNA dihydrouridine synthase DusB [Bacteroidota bacterium]
MVTLGNLELGENLLLLAPMEDVTDVAFRLIAREQGADAVYTEFISSEALIRAAAKSMKKLVTHEAERPVAIQIYGGDPDVMREAARISEEAGPDFIDINCGCWVRNVVGHGAGAGLLKDPPRMERMVRAVVDTVKLPVTVKTRLGWDHNAINILEIAPMLEQAGAQALTIHCRTRSQGHTGDADWSWIPKIKQVVSIPVFLNGDVKTPEDAERAFHETGADGVMIARAAISNPFIFRQIKELRETGSYAQPSLDERVRLCIRHLIHSCEVRTERRGIFAFRKHYAGYFRGVPGIGRLRSDLMQITSVEAVVERLERFAQNGEVPPDLELEQENPSADALALAA